MEVSVSLFSIKILLLLWLIVTFIVSAVPSWTAPSNNAECVIVLVFNLFRMQLSTFSLLVFLLTRVFKRSLNVD